MTNTTNQRPELFRLLLLEDDDDLREDLALVIPRRLPGTVVDAAGTVEEGLHLLETDRDFALGLLDIRVPFRRGLQPEADPRVAEGLKRRGVASLCFTGYRESPDVEHYLAKRKLTDPPIATISKQVTPEFLTLLMNEIRLWLVSTASARVSASFRRIFSSTPDGLRSGTAPLMSLQQEIIDYWAYLDETTRDEIKSRFVVDEQDGAIVTLSLSVQQV